MVAAVYQSGHSKRDTRSFMHSSGIFGWEVTEDMHKCETESKGAVHCMQAPKLRLIMSTGIPGLTLMSFF